MPSGEGNKNSPNKSVGLISQKKKNNFASATHFFFLLAKNTFAVHILFVHFFAVVLHDYDVASRNFLVTLFMEEMLYVFLFTFLFAATHFHLGAASISHFLTATVKFSHYSYDEIGLLCFLISRSSSFSVIHINVDIETKWKERIDFVVVPGGYVIYRQNARVLEMQNFNPAYKKG